MATDFDLETFLDGLPDSSLAWMANRIAGQPAHHVWASRDAAIATVLHCHAALADDNPLKELPWRFALTPTLAELLR